MSNCDVNKPFLGSNKLEKMPQKMFKKVKIIRVIPINVSTGKMHL